MKDVLVYDGWLKVYHRQVDNRQYDIVKNFDAVSAIILNEFNEILLVKQFRPSVMNYTLEIPAGCLDISGESAENCLVREIKEETGLDIPIESLEKVISYKPMMGFSNSTMTLFKVHVQKSSLKTTLIDDDDVTEVKWIPFDKFEEKIKDGIIFDSKSIMSYLYIKSDI